MTLRQFQQALEIRDAFFPTGGNLPSFTMAVTPLTLAGDAANARFEINGTPVVSQQGVNAPRASTTSIQDLLFTGPLVHRTLMERSIDSVPLPMRRPRIVRSSAWCSRIRSVPSIH